MSETKLIVGWEDAGRSGGALELGALFARLIEAELIVVHVFPAASAFLVGATDFDASSREHAEGLLGDAAKLLGDGVPHTELALAAHSAAQGLAELAEREGAQMVLIGSTRRGAAGRVIAGDTGAALLHGGPCPVAVAPHAYRVPSHGLRAIGVAFDGRRESELALSAARVLASRFGASLNLITVAEPPGLLGAEAIVGISSERVMEAAREELSAALKRALESVPGSIRVDSQLLEGHAASELAGAACGLDLLVSGSRGYGPMGRVLLGSTSARLAHNAPCPLLVVPRSAKDAP